MSNLSISAVALTLVACVAPGSSMDESASPDGGATTPSEPDAGTPSEPDAAEPVEVAIASEYRLQSTLGVTAGSLAPPPAYDLLKDLDSDPGAALVTIAETAGIPAADILFDALPSSISGKVTGWMSDAIDSSAELQTLIAWSQVVLAEVELSSTLAVGALDEEEHAIASHTLDALHFQLDGRAIEQSIPTIEEIPGAGHVELDVWIDRDDEGRHMVLGEQTFGLLLGEAAYRAFESAVEARYGQDMRGLLGSSMNCPAMAAEVADKCVLGVCVGHATELENLCEAALDEAVEMIHDQFSALDTELLRLSSGSALVVENPSAAGTLLEEGQWDASAEFGLGLRDIAGSFSGASAQ